MNISKEKFKNLIRYTFYSGMELGYGVNHENKAEDEEEAWKTFVESDKKLRELLGVVKD